MAKAHVLFWFDVEDCTVPQSDDAAKRLVLILERHGVRGTMKVVGQKARVLEQRVRYDVIDALRRHDIGFHGNWHGLRPQIAEYLAPLDFEAGAAEFDRREGPGLTDIHRVFGVHPVTYGQPGPNWAPQVFRVLRQWDIPTYVSGFGYVGVDCQPFWYEGVLCTSHLYGRRLSGEAQQHLMGMNFELGKPGELQKHRDAFGRSHQQLSGAGGLISVLNHPCALVLEEWFSTYLKPRELTEAGYRHFEDFLTWALALPNARATCASELPALYADGAVAHSFSREELLALAGNLTEEVTWQRLGDLTVAAAEAFGLLVNALVGAVTPGGLTGAVRYRPVYSPHQAPEPAPGEPVVSWDAFVEAVRSVAGFVNRQQRLPAEIAVDSQTVTPAAFLAAVARVVGRVLRAGSAPDSVRIVPTTCRFADHVDEAAATGGWKSVMLPPGFTAPNLLALARLGAWTMKPAVLRCR